LSSEISNYRPISVLSSFSKIYEKIISIRLNSFIKKQYSEFKSIWISIMSFNIYDTFRHILQSIWIYRSRQICKWGVYWPTKSFDRIDHSILLAKLKYYGIRGKTLSWFTDYLKNRKLFVVFADIQSEKKLITHGVPQGSILGPTLFILWHKWHGTVFKQF